MMMMTMIRHDKFLQILCVVSKLPGTALAAFTHKNQFLALVAL
jgi:hypothetical protein